METIITAINIAPYIKKLLIATSLLSNEAAFTQQDLRDAINKCDVEKVQKILASGNIEGLNKESFKGFEKLAKKNQKSTPQQKYPISNRWSLLGSGANSLVSAFAVGFFLTQREALPETAEEYAKRAELAGEIVGAMFVGVHAVLGLSNVSNGVFYSAYKDDKEIHQEHVENECKKIYQLLSDELKKHS